MARRIALSRCPVITKLWVARHATGRLGSRHPASTDRASDEPYSCRRVCGHACASESGHKRNGASRHTDHDLCAGPGPRQAVGRNRAHDRGLHLLRVRRDPGLLSEPGVFAAKLCANAGQSIVPGRKPLRRAAAQEQLIAPGGNRRRPDLRTSPFFASSAPQLGQTCWHGCAIVPSLSSTQIEPLVCAVPICPALPACSPP